MNHQTGPLAGAAASETPMLDSLMERPATLASMASPATPRRADGIALARLVSIDDQGHAHVAIAELGIEDVIARSLVPVDPSRIGATLAVGFEGADPNKPMLLGFMLDPQVPNPTAPAATAPEPLVLVDNSHVVIEAQQTIELRCGESALILQADGTILLRGTHLTSYATATQRILGGSVQIN